MQAACESYLQVFNTGVHYSFLASVAAMLISLLIFLIFKKMFPTPAKKTKAEVVEYTPEERQAMAKDIKQRMAGLYAVLGICVFFWMSFHQNGQSLSLFARNFVNSDSVAPEVWQFLNPALVILLTPVIMWLFGTSWGRKFSAPRKIVIGMLFAACAYIFLTIFSMHMGYPSGEAFMKQDAATIAGMKADACVLIVTYFFLTVAELFISPMGLSFVSKIAPKHIQGICQGLWLTATAVGNLLIMVGPFLFNKLPNLWMTWAVFAIICLIAMTVMFGMLKWLERITSQQQ
jgi:POT family proton-dependent oligopeptide transporter